MIRTYKVAGHLFRIEAADDCPLWDKSVSSYGVFETSETGHSIFTLTLSDGFELQDPHEIYSNKEDVEDGFMTLTVFRTADGYCFEMTQPRSEVLNGKLSVTEDFSVARLVLNGTPLQKWLTFNSAVNFCYFLSTACLNTILIHASSVIYKGKAYVFLGKSGTGKSTHTRMWLNALDGVVHLNDDHPVLRVDDDGTVMAYGSPWSGKTPCYKNLSAPLGGVIRIVRAPYNKARRLSPIEAYASIMPSISGMTWDRTLADGKNATMQGIISSVPCWVMECLPDENAALVCSAAVVETEDDRIMSEIIGLLNEGRSVVFKPKGNSMLPFIRSGKDEVVLMKSSDYKVGDIVLARLGDKKYVIHRILSIKDGKVLLMGDGNIKGCESCAESDICAVVSMIRRDGKEIDCNGSLHKRQAALWKRLLPVRRLVLGVYKRLFI